MTPIQMEMIEMDLRQVKFACDRGEFYSPPYTLTMSYEEWDKRGRPTKQPVVLPES